MGMFLIPVFEYDTETAYITSIRARNYTDAQEKCMKHICHKYDLEEPGDWEDFCENILPNTDIVIGAIQDIEEFE